MRDHRSITQSRALAEEGKEKGEFYLFLQFWCGKQEEEAVVEKR